MDGWKIADVSIFSWDCEHHREYWINIERFQPGFIRKHMDLHLGYRHSQDDVQQPKKYHTNHCFLDLKVTSHQGFTIVHICWERTGKPGTNLEKPWKHLETPWKNHGNTMEKTIKPAGFTIKIFTAVHRAVESRPSFPSCETTRKSSMPSGPVACVPVLNVGGGCGGAWNNEEQHDEQDYINLRIYIVYIYL